METLKETLTVTNECTEPTISRTQCVAYVRVSTDAQAGEDRFGIDNQKAIIEDYAQTHGYTISRWYIDRGESGVKENRPQMNALLYSNDVANPPIGAVLVAKSDRVARDIKLYYYFMMLLEKKGMHLISCTEEVVNDDTGLGNVYKSLMLFVAEQERKNISMRTAGGRAIKASTGGYAGGRPAYGYDVVNHAYVPNEAQADNVREIFKLKEMGLTMKEIVDVMNSDDRPTYRTNPKWTLSLLQVILNNRKLYEGYAKYGKDADWVEGQHEAIIPRPDTDSVDEGGDDE